MIIKSFCVDCMIQSTICIRGVATGAGGIWVYIPPKSVLVKMKPERLLNMSIKFYTFPKILYPPPKKKN